MSKFRKFSYQDQDFAFFLGPSDHLIHLRWTFYPINGLAMSPYHRPLSEILFTVAVMLCHCLASPGDISSDGARRSGLGRYGGPQNTLHGPPVDG